MVTAERPLPERDPAGSHWAQPERFREVSPSRARGAARLSVAEPGASAYRWGPGAPPRIGV